MRILKMRQRLQQLGYVLEQNQQGFTVTDGAVKHPIELHFANLDEVKLWADCGNWQKANRLTEDECLQWDKDFEDFCDEEKSK